MWKKLGIVWLLVILSVTAHGREPVKALYVALADHYPGVVAFERYRSQMDRAELSLLQMSSWRLLRSYFRSGRADLAFIISPMALDMFAEQPDFRWVGLIHRNGNALAVNELLATDAELLSLRRDRKPDSRVAEAIRNKPEALAEVIHYIQQAGADIDHARSLGGEPLREMAQLIRRHIPAHTEEAIIQSLDRELDVIHYHDLDVDLEGMRRVMDLALEGGVLQQTVELEQFADTRFSSEADVKHWKEYHLQQESGGEPEEAVRGPLLSNP